MAEQPSTDTLVASRTALNDNNSIGENNACNFKSKEEELLPLLHIRGQWGDVLSSFAIAEKKLELKEQMVCEKESEVELLRNELALREKDFEERLKVKENEFEARMRKLGEECGVLEERKRGFVEECRCLEVKKRGIREECRCLEVKVKEMRVLIEELESKKRGIVEEFKVLGDRNKGMDGKNREIEGREKEVNERVEKVELREREVVELGRLMGERKKTVNELSQKLDKREKEVDERFNEIELREKKIVEGSRLLEERKKRVDRLILGLEGREKEIDERVKKVELREKEIVAEGKLVERKNGMDERSRGLERRENEIDERDKEVKLREKGLDERSEKVERREMEIREHEDGLELRENRLGEVQRKLQLREKDIEKRFETSCEEMRLMKDQLVESHRALVLKEREIIEQCTKVKFKQERMIEKWKAIEMDGKEISSSFNMLESKEKEINEGLKALELMSTHENVDCTKTAEMNALELTRKPIEECFIVLESDGQMNQSNEVEALKAGPIKKCSHLSSSEVREVGEILKQQTLEVSGDACMLTEKQVIESRNRLNFQGKLVNEGPLADISPVSSAVATNLATEIQLVFRNNGARATASYLIKYANKDDTRHNKMPCLSEEISGVIRFLVAKREHLVAAMCSCVFKMEAVFPPKFLLEAHLQSVRKKAEDILKQDSVTAQDDAAKMELSGLKDLLQCISDFKLQSIYTPTSLELHITQLEKEMEERGATTTRIPNHEKKRKAPSDETLKQIKHFR